MDWTKQTEEMFKTWTETQKKMWDNWLETIDQGSMPAQAAETWQKSLDTWEGAMKNILAAQNEWARMWTENLSGTKNVPKEMVEWAQQAQGMNQRWNDGQQQLWHSWFEAARKVEPGEMPEAWAKEGEKLFRNWQESAQQIMEEQIEWIRTWTPGQAKAETSKKK